MTGQILRALTIAGFDPCGGAGIQADLKTFAAHRLYGLSVAAAVTAQNSKGVISCEPVSPDLIAAQINGLFDDAVVDAVKIGMLFNSKSIDAVSESLRTKRVPFLVLDPVILSSSGFELLDREGREIMLEKLFPYATLVTPNIPEAEILTGEKILSFEDMERAGEKLLSHGCRSVLVKGGHFQESHSADILISGEGKRYFHFQKNDFGEIHGTGCTLSSAIASNAALGYDLEKSILKAREYLVLAMKTAFYPKGGCYGFLNHFHGEKSGC